MHRPLCRAAILAAPLALAACLTPAPAADPAIADQARALREQAARIYAGLAAARAPGCSFERHQDAHDELDTAARALRDRIVASEAAPALTRAGTAIARLVEQGRASHQAASARTDDTHGPCMAPGAIALNGGAIDRAAAALIDAIALAPSPAGERP